MQLQMFLTKDVPDAEQNGLGLVLFGKSHSSWIEFQFDGEGYSFHGNLLQHEVGTLEATYKGLLNGERFPFYELPLGEVPGDLAPWLFHVVKRVSHGRSADAPPKRIWRRKTGIATAQAAETIRAVFQAYGTQPICWNDQAFTVGDRIRHSKDEVAQLFAVHQLAQEHLVTAWINDPVSAAVAPPVVPAPVFFGADWEDDWQRIAA